MRGRVIVLVVVGALLGLVPLTAGAADSVTRADGSNRILTAIALSQRAFPTGGSAGAAVVARAGDFADALAAAPLAVAANGPVLLNPRGELDADVEAEIERLGADTVYLMGGEAAQSAQVEESLKQDAAGVSQVIRVEDPDFPDRFGTAAQAARLAAELWGGDAGSHVLITLGAHPQEDRAWPDALSAGQLAGHARRPILLVGTESVPAATDAALDDLGATTATVIGGPAAVPADVAADLDVTTQLRIGGQTRYDTSRLVAQAALAVGASVDTVVVATGTGFADGLAAGPAAVHLGGVLLLVAPDHLADSPFVHDWLADRHATIGDVVVAGGRAAVSDAVVEHLGQATAGTAALQLAWQPVAIGFDGALDVTTRAGDARMYVAEQRGVIWQVFPDGGKVEFLDIQDRVSSGGERGLLGIAFHPTQPNRLFVYYTRENASNATRLSEFRVVGDTVDDTNETALDDFAQPYANHNGGGLVFAPDDTLWLGLGDGGSSNDPDGNGQDTDTELGSLLRYEILGAAGDWDAPADNPFVGGGGQPTIAHYGLRNPFRFSFDRIDGKLFIGDVGQSAREEIDALSTDLLGRNFGWDCKEGTLDGSQPTNCDPSATLTPPVHEYPTGSGNCAVTGGVVYRGRALPELAGTYLYADFCEGSLRSLRLRDDGTAAEQRTWSINAGNPAGFGVDHDGEVYVADLGGRLLKLVRG